MDVIGTRPPYWDEKKRNWVPDPRGPMTMKDLKWPKKPLAEVWAEEVEEGTRCPCMHLPQRHRKAEEGVEGAMWGACRDCACKGLIR